MAAAASRPSKAPQKPQLPQAVRAPRQAGGTADVSLHGGPYSGFGEKQNDRFLELRMRYYFWAEGPTVAPLTK